MGQAERWPDLLDGDGPASVAEAQAISELAAEVRLLRKGIGDLAALAGNLEGYAKQFDGAASPLDLRSPSDDETHMQAAFAGMLEGMKARKALEHVDAVATLAIFKWAWRARMEAPLPDGPELPQDAQEWARMRRALKLARPLARLAHEVHEGLEKLRREVAA